jgi:hypothetical protein
VRGIHNRAIQQLSVISPPGSEDIELMIDLATKGTAFVQAAVHSLEAGDWTLSGEDDGEKLQLWHKKDLSSGRVGLVEDAYKMEAFVEEGIPPPLAAFDQRHTVELDDGEDGSPEAPPAPRRRLQVVHTQKIMAGSVKLSETRRVYRFQLDDAVETRDLLAEAKEKVAEANKMAEAKASHRTRCKRDKNELIAAIGEAIGDACKEAEEAKLEKQHVEQHAKHAGHKRQRGKKTMVGAQAHEAKGNTRGGWYNRRQLVMGCFLAGHDGLDMKMADQFFHGDDGGSAADAGGAAHAEEDGAAQGGDFHGWRL